MPFTPSATSAASLGSTAGLQLSGAMGVGVGKVSKSTVVMSTPDTPSTRAWCVLLMSAKRPPSRPCTSHSSHSGLDRSSRWEKIRPASMRSWSWLPGLGSAVCRTWYSRLKRGSSTHSGRPISSLG